MCLRPQTYRCDAPPLHRLRNNAPNVLLVLESALTPTTYDACFSFRCGSCGQSSRSQQYEGLTGEQILAEACSDEYKESAELPQFALGGTETTYVSLNYRDPPIDSHVLSSGRDFTTKIPHVIPTHNGLVDTVIEAYNEHHAGHSSRHVWLAILSQFNVFVNANAEVLRTSFVAHEDKQPVLIVAGGTRHGLDFGKMMGALIDKNVVDPGLRTWALPSFMTTTENDTTVAAALHMATLKEYLSYRFESLEYGIPRVTLQDENADWEAILGRLEKSKKYALEAIA
ncbi:hypothetical protein C8R44DRAFT_875242 [Mycena epipterygia]|nr:hypothetical protein C8R44DRAFT_875242 [Mycena epipterygia]